MRGCSTFVAIIAGFAVILFGAYQFDISTHQGPPNPAQSIAFIGIGVAIVLISVADYFYFSQRPKR